MADFIQFSPDANSLQEWHPTIMSASGRLTGLDDFPTPTRPRRFAVLRKRLHLESKRLLSSFLRVAPTRELTVTDQLFWAMTEIRRGQTPFATQLISTAKKIIAETQDSRGYWGDKIEWKLLLNEAEKMLGQIE